MDERFLQRFVLNSPDEEIAKLLCSINGVSYDGILGLYETRALDIDIEVDAE